MFAYIYRDGAKALLLHLWLYFTMAMDRFLKPSVHRPTCYFYRGVADPSLQQPAHCRLKHQVAQPNHTAAHENTKGSIP